MSDKELSDVEVAFVLGLSAGVTCSRRKSPIEALTSIIAAQKSDWDESRADALTVPGIKDALRCLYAHGWPPSMAKRTPSSGSARELVEEIDGLYEKATDGEWQSYWRSEAGLADCGVFVTPREGIGVSVCRAPRYEKRAQWEANGALIAKLKNAWPRIRSALAGGGFQTIATEMQEDSMSDLLPCPKCGQVNFGQEGEYPCEACGVPRTWWDDTCVPPSLEKGRTSAPRAPTFSDGLEAAAKWHEEHVAQLREAMKGWNQRGQDCYRSAIREHERHAASIRSLQPAATSGETGETLKRDDSPHFDRFTDRARKVMSFAKAEAARYGHHYIGTHHVLHGLIEENGGVAHHVLLEAGVDITKVRDAWSKLIADGESNPPGETRATNRVEAIARLAWKTAFSLGDSYIGTEHLLLGLLEEGRGIGAVVLGNLGVDLDALRARTFEFLGRDDPNAKLEPSSSPSARGPQSGDGHLGDASVDELIGGNS